MNRKIVALILFCLLSACAMQGSPGPLPARTVPVTEGQSIFIQLDEGEITIQAGEAGQVRVEGQTVSPDKTEFSVETVDGQVRITVTYTGKPSSGAPVHLEVSIPEGIPLRIASDSASITVRNFSGALEAESVSGDILVEDASGEIVLRSNRGDVEVRKSSGTISVVGNYGSLTLEGSSGDIGMSTIMGTITFNGSINTDDAVRLETDHGPVAVNLSPDSALMLQVTSNSGNVACMLPDVAASLRTCGGVLNAGGGSLNIRTVSGAVTLQLIP
jgi:DUF4097 and DUF4098 domain-containing protein YvlB